MKRLIIVKVVLTTLVSALFASEAFYSDLSEAQRYDLAAAYAEVADHFESMGDAQRAQEYRKRVPVIFPGFGETARPVEEPEPVVQERPVPMPADPAGGDAAYYYFNKLLRGVFNENMNITLSVLADVLYLPMFDSGVGKEFAVSELRWFFDNYDASSMAPSDVFDTSSINVTPLDNGYWRLDVSTMPGHESALDDVTFWSAKMGFYFRKFTEGWRLAAIGPVA